MSTLACKYLFSIFFLITMEIIMKIEIDAQMVVGIINLIGDMDGCISIAKLDEAISIRRALIGMVNDADAKAKATTPVEAAK
jgi:hypothetical protein